MIEIINGIHETIKYRDLSQFRLYHNIENEDYPTHWHVGIEIIMPLKNHYTVATQNERIILEEEDIIIINTGIIHSLEAPPSGERIIIQFDLSLLNILKEFETMIFMMPPVIVFRASEKSDLYDKIYHNLTNIIQEYDRNQAFKEAFIYSKLIEIYGELARHEMYCKDSENQEDQDTQRRNLEVVLRACDYINLHYQENITLDQVSEACGFSKYHFSRVFKQFMDMTFYEYLKYKRIKQATLLLSNQEMSITEIAMESGFHSISSFNRTFKEINGRSPSSYRNTVKYKTFM